MTGSPNICRHDECAYGNETQPMRSAGKAYHRPRTRRAIYSKEKADTLERKFPNMNPLERDSCSLA